MSYYKNNREKVYTQQKEYRQTIEGKSALRKANRKLLNKYRLPVLNHYGKICKCCGEKTDELLTVDHIDNDGAEHRKQLNECSYKIYKDIIKKKYPSNFQILCMNCNWGRQMFGKCPHKML